MVQSRTRKYHKEVETSLRRHERSVSSYLSLFGFQGQSPWAFILSDAMILTQCACCAAPLPHLAKQCSRCKTRYCGPACQKQHWEGGGHDLLCKKIKKGGGAEQYNADKKFVAAVATAAEECAEATKGQTCYICTEAVHRRTKEGLVRGCACRGTAGFAHVSCLVEQVKILCDEAEANNLDFKDFKPRWDRWSSCSLCEQSYHGVVKCALGWACWKTYLGRNSEQDFTIRLAAMTELGNGLFSAQAAAEALVVHKAQVVAYARNPPSSDQIDLPYLGALSNVANCFVHSLGEKRRRRSSVAWSLQRKGLSTAMGTWNQ